MLRLRIIEKKFTRKDGMVSCQVMVMPTIDGKDAGTVYPLLYLNNSPTLRNSYTMESDGEHVRVFVFVGKSVCRVDEDFDLNTGKSIAFSKVMTEAYKFMIAMFKDALNEKLGETSRLTADIERMIGIVSRESTYMNKFKDGPDYLFDYVKRQYDSVDCIKKSELKKGFSHPVGSYVWCVDTDSGENPSVCMRKVTGNRISLSEQTLTREIFIEGMGEAWFPDEYSVFDLGKKTFVKALCNEFELCGKLAFETHEDARMYLLREIGCKEN